MFAMSGHDLANSVPYSQHMQCSGGEWARWGPVTEGRASVGWVQRDGNWRGAFCGVNRVIVSVGVSLTLFSLSRLCPGVFKRRGGGLGSRLASRGIAESVCL